MFYKEINDIKIRLIVIIALLLISLVTFIVLKPYSTDLIKSLYSEVEEFPDFLKSIFGDESTLSKFEDNNYYLLSQWQGKNLGQFIPMVILIITFPLISKEYDKKTIYLLLSRINRNKLFLKKYFFGLIVSIFTISILVFLGPIFMNLFGYKTGYNSTFLIYIQELFSIIFLYNLFFLFSIIFKEQIKVLILGILICLSIPFFSFINPISFLNIYPYLFGHNILNGNNVDWIYSFVLLFLSFVLFYVSKIHFCKKEI